VPRLVSRSRWVASDLCDDTAAPRTRITSWVDVGHVSRVRKKVSSAFTGPGCARNVKDRHWGVAFGAAPLRCLIVDDNAGFRDTARRLLERDGLAVVGVASTLAEALSSARKLKPDVTLIDVHLGPDSGFDLVRRLRQEQWTARAALILTSAGWNEEFAERSTATAADGFVPKSALSGDRIRELARLDGRRCSAVGEKGDRG
jgi:CheY-like chemotaxis protein